MDVSIVVPLLNEHESLPILAERLHRVLGEMAVRYEVIFVDDGSTDGSWPVIERLAREAPQGDVAAGLQRRDEVLQPGIDDVSLPAQHGRDRIGPRS